ncbi:MAG: sulfurtransferase [Nitrospiraceae bacterium]|nr:MAG: sulfurtransferase [Nitrospiraceae bacterium]
MFHNLERNKTVGRKILTTLFALLLFSLLLGSQTVFAGAQAVVETSWLAENLKKPGIKIVYVATTNQNDKAAFDGKHIPGSVYLDIPSLMGVVGSGNPPDKAGFEALMGKLGVSNSNHVIIYTGFGGHSFGAPFAAGTFWLMDYFGHNNVSILNGGMKKWADEKRETTSDPAKITPTAYKAAAPDASIFADADYVLKNIKNPKVALLDTRAHDEYTGANPLGNKRAGHIPGSVNVDYYITNLNPNETFKSVGDLKAAYESKGVTKDKEIISYCQGGIRAAHSYVVLKYLLGYPKVRNYVGSIGEWANKLDPAKYPLEK